MANIAAIEIVDLPLSDSEGSIEDQMKNSNGKKLIDECIKSPLKIMKKIYNLLCL